MSLMSSLSISLSGITATSTRLEIASNNIANASVDGYTKKTANLISTTLGDTGSGVQVSGFSRASNNTLFTTLTRATSEAGKLETQDEYLQKVLDILGTSSSDSPALSQKMAGFVNAWTQLASEPESSVSQQQVIQASENLASEIKRVAEEIERLDRECVNDINGSLEDLNGYLEQIQDINGKISLLTTSRMSTGDLEDERDRVILEIAKMLDVTAMDRSNGQIALYTKSGYQLVDGASICDFSYDESNITEEGNISFSLNGTLKGGSIEALINFRTQTTPVSTESGVSVIQKLRDQLDAIVESLTSVVSTATSGELSFAAAYNNSNAVEARRTLADAMSFTALTPGTAGNDIDVTIAAGTTAGTYQITITDGTTTENFDDINIGAGPYDWTSMVDAIMAQPSLLVSAQINGTGALDPADISLGSAYGLFGGANAGTDPVEARRTITEALRFTAIDAGADGNGIDVIIDAGTTAGLYKITITDGTTTEVIDDIDIGAGPYDWTNMAAEIMALPSSLVTAEVNGSGTLDPTTLTMGAVYDLYGGAEEAAPSELATDFFTGTDRTNIAVNAALLNGTSTVKTSSTGAVVDALLDSTRLFTADGINVAGASYSSLVTSIMSGTQQNAKNIASLSDTANSQKEYLQEKMANQTGVNTDEEMVNLVVLQQAYTASARIMTVVNELFDVLASTV